jgi:hypothetical protein
VHHVERQRVQAEIVSLPQQRGAALDLQHLQRAVPLIGHDLAQVLISGAEPGEHVHERPAAGRLLGGDDTVRIIERASQRQLDEHVPARPHGAHGDLGVQPGGQAYVHQVHRGISDHGVQVGRGGEPELATDLRQFLRGPSEHDHLVHVGPLGVNGGVRLAKPGAQQRDLHRGQLLLRQPAPADAPAAGHARAGARPPR